MLATFIIGLREGLEAALIVGIIAAFLRNNNKSLVPMWWGVGLAILLSIAVGAMLSILERALPQAAQEGMESVIGLIAIVFVTGMISWMNSHARNLKREIEAETAEALGQASSFALASMAFLAVLKEGFETSVFLLATFSAAQSATLAALGATAGLLAAVVVGWGIYVGGVKINLGRFFRFTGAFLILVAAGLVVTSLRTAHEAGWLNAGQQTVLNLSWLVAPGTIRSALITGVLGIPADPRLIEAIGWIVYLIPVSLYVYWPAARRPKGLAAAKLQFAVALGLAMLALGLAAFSPKPILEALGKATIVSQSEAASPAIGFAWLGSDTGGSGQSLTIAIKGASPVSVALSKPSERATHEGFPAERFELTGSHVLHNSPASLTLDEVAEIGGGRIPVGFDPGRSPGPFTAEWSGHETMTAWTSHGMLLDASGSSVTIVKLSGGGLHTPRILRISADDKARAADSWQVSPTYRESAAAALQSFETTRMEQRFWAIEIPILLFAACLLTGLAGLRTLAVARRSKNEKDRCPSDTNTFKGATHVTH